MYQTKSEGNFLELNASDERGIDMVRNKVKDFARSKSMGDVPFKIIILDESDSMTEDAQHALRRTMEKFTSTARFILIANFLYRIIGPIQSRCSILRFTPMSTEVIRSRLEYILKLEKRRFESEALEVIVSRSRGDMRWAINAVQTIAASGSIVNKKMALEIVGKLHLQEIRNIVGLAIAGKFVDAQKILSELLYDAGFSGRDITREIHNAILEADLKDKFRISAICSLAEAEYRITQGADPEIQIAAVLGNLSLSSDSE
jgi:replication factor C small subunit